MRNIRPLMADPTQRGSSIGTLVQFHNEVAKPS